MKKNIVVMLALGAFTGQGYAAEALQGDIIRIDASYNKSALGFDDGIDEVIYLESSIAGIGTYQSEKGFYGQLGFARFSGDEVQINGKAFDTDYSYSVRAFGLGYRVPRASGEGLYWGLGYQNTKPDTAGADPTNSFRLFWEKEQVSRYGVITIAYNTNDFLNLLSVSGKHVWFGQSGFGAGVTWSIGSGKTDTGFEPEDNVAFASLGALIMFRAGK